MPSPMVWNVVYGCPLNQPTALHAIQIYIDITTLLKVHTSKSPDFIAFCIIDVIENVLFRLFTQCALQ